MLILKHLLYLVTVIIQISHFLIFFSNFPFFNFSNFPFFKFRIFKFSFFLLSRDCPNSNFPFKIFFFQISHF